MNNDLISRAALLEWLCEGCNGAKKVGCGSPCCDYDLIMEAPTIDAVPVVRCKDCKYSAPLPEEARKEFSTDVIRCLNGRGDCDRYCTTWENGFCDEGERLAVL